MHTEWGRSSALAPLAWAALFFVGCAANGGGTGIPTGRDPGAIADGGVGSSDSGSRPIDGGAPASDAGAGPEASTTCPPDPIPEICDNGLDEDCDGMVDEGCATIIEVMVSLDGDCLTASCPAEAPYPVGCNIRMEGGDPRGCVASDPMSPVVYFQEGDACGAGRVTGTLLCSSEPGTGLAEANCVINKDTRYYPRDRGGCPDAS